MTNQGNEEAAGAAGEFPDSNSGLNAVDLDAADTAEAGSSPVDSGEAASDAADEAPAVDLTGDVQGEPGFGDPAAAATADEPAAAGDPVAELTDDLQRLNAEYANYRKRSEERGQIVGEVAVAGVLNELLPILDDLDRAQEHGDYDGVVKSIGDALQGTLTKLGLSKYGEAGDEFDPAVHEGLMTVEATDGQAAQIVGQVLRPGYKVNDRVIRTAGVAVTQ